jgi:hypothetical protein
VSAIDQERLAAAVRARDRIEAFVRSRLGARSGQGYAPAELRELNASRHSQDTFDPYRRPGDSKP